MKPTATSRIEQLADTTTFARDAAPSRPACVALVPGSQVHLTQDIRGLLRQRLGIAGLIGLAGFGIFFIKNLVVPSPINTPLDLTLQGIVFAVLAVICAALYTRVPLKLGALRTLELVLFAAMGFFFVYMQYTHFNHGRFVRWAQPQFQEHVLDLGVFANTMRWWMLIVLYGTFIPNTWSRCAWVVATMALTPLVMTVWLCADCQLMGPYVPRMLFDMTILLALASAIAVFGSYKISKLQQQAFEARKLGQYILHRQLGAGGMGEVYLAEHMLLRRACAIKLIRPDQAGDPENLSRFVREVQVMATLTHWNTVEVYDYGHTAKGVFYYVMEYLPGLNLQVMVDGFGPLPPARAIHFLRQVCAALKEAHKIGLIHRDIKPSNVIICQRGGVDDVAKLLDFGVVHGHGSTEPEDKLTWKGAILGSPPFMAPEQALGKHVTVQSDIYSMGALAYFLLTGRPPFVRETNMELLVAHVHEAVVAPREFRPELPGDLEEVILRCLSKDPYDRYLDIAHLDQALADCQASDLWDQDQAAMWWQEFDGSARKKMESVQG